jgi:hypothetical protein
MPTIFDPPANLTDFEAIPEQPEAWHALVSALTDAAIERAENLVGRGHCQYYNPAARDPGGQLAERVITWNGFPKTLYEDRTEPEAWQAAEELAQFRYRGRNVKARRQDEYLEWFSHRDGDGRIVAVDFTCEGPEYWHSLAEGYPDSVEPEAGWPAASGDPDALVDLYRRHVSANVGRDDLFAGGRYNPYNAWNTERGAMHLTHPSNTLSAEIFLAGDATVLREREGQVLEDDDELIECAAYGDPARASDPTIGGAVNSLARAGALITLKNPVGLYIDSLDTTGWTKPDGSEVGDYWQVVRGTPEATVRARYEVPESEGFAVGDIQIGGEPIRWAGQIAERITMKLAGQAAELGSHRAQPVGCEATPAGLAAPSHPALVEMSVRAHA